MQVGDGWRSAASGAAHTSSCSVCKAATSTAVNTGSYTMGGRARPGSSAVSASASVVWCRGTSPGHVNYMERISTTLQRQMKAGVCTLRCFVSLHFAIGQTMQL